MNNLVNWFTKRNLLITAFLLGGLSFFFGYVSSNNECFLAYKQCESVAYTLIIFIPLFVLAIPFSFTKESTFISWRKFLSWWIPLSVLLIILSPLSPADLSPIYKKSVFWIMGGGLTIISLILIFYKSLKK